MFNHLIPVVYYLYNKKNVNLRKHNVITHLIFLIISMILKLVYKLNLKDSNFNFFGIFDSSIIPLDIYLSLNFFSNLKYELIFLIIFLCLK